MGKVSQWWCWWCWWWWCFRDGASIWVRPGAAGNGFCWSWEGNSRGTESGTRLAWQHRHVERQVLDQCAQSLHGWWYVVDILYLNSVPSLHGRWYVLTWHLVLDHFFSSTLIPNLQSLRVCETVLTNHLFLMLSPLGFLKSHIYSCPCNIVNLSVWPLVSFTPFSKNLSFLHCLRQWCHSQF